MSAPALALKEFPNTDLDASLKPVGGGSPAWSMLRYGSLSLPRP